MDKENSPLAAAKTALEMNTTEAASASYRASQLVKKTSGTGNTPITTPSMRHRLIASGKLSATLKSSSPASSSTITVTGNEEARVASSSSSSSTAVTIEMPIARSIEDDHLRDEAQPLTATLCAAVLKSNWIHHKQPYTIATPNVMISVNPYAPVQLAPDSVSPRLIVGDVMERIRVAHSRGDLSTLHDDDEISITAEKEEEQPLQQVIVVCGDSGSGKTEMCKQLLEEVCATTSRGGEIAARITATNSLIEAFGNAKTDLNANSSRFAKTIELRLDPESGVTRGASISTLLLEKSRITSIRSETDRNFHVFYQFVSGCQMDRHYGSLLVGREVASAPDGQEAPAAFKYLGPPRSEKEARADMLAADETLKSLARLDVSAEQRQDLIRAIGSILHLGNLEFELVPSLEGEGQAIAGVGGASVSSSGSTTRTVVSRASRTWLTRAARLMGVEEEDLECALCQRGMKVNNEHIQTYVSVNRANATRDVLAREMYSRAFQFLVRKINASLAAAAPESTTNDGRETALQGPTLKILDIFGFESFESNSFEQLLINYANEKLQAQFVRRTCAQVEAEYLREGITLCHGFPQPNTGNNPALRIEDESVVSLFEDPTKGIFALLTQECLLGQSGSDAKFVANAVMMNGGRNGGLSGNLILSPSFIGLEAGGGGRKTTRLSGPAPPRRFSHCTATRFSVAHYGGVVEYDARFFIEKAMDLVSSRINQLLEATATRNRALSSTNAATSHDAANTTGRLSTKNLATHFKTEMSRVVADLERTDNVHWVRCIRPNRNRSDRHFDDEMVERQLRASGIVQSILVARRVFPRSLTRARFARRYGFLPTPQTAHPSAAQTGLTKVYYSDCYAKSLEVMRSARLKTCAVKIQRATRTLLDRLRKSRSAARIQAFVRAVERRRQLQRAIAEVARRWRAIKAEEEEKVIELASVRSASTSVSTTSLDSEERLDLPDVASPPVAEFAASQITRVKTELEDKDRIIAELRAENARLRGFQETTPVAVTAEPPVALKAKLQDICARMEATGVGRAECGGVAHSSSTTTMMTMMMTLREPGAARHRGMWDAMENKSQPERRPSPVKKASDWLQEWVLHTLEADEESGEEVKVEREQVSMEEVERLRRHNEILTAYILKEHKKWHEGRNRVAVETHDDEEYDELDLD